MNKKIYIENCACERCQMIDDLYRFNQMILCKECIEEVLDDYKVFVAEEEIEK